MNPNENNQNQNSGNFLKEIIKFIIIALIVIIPIRTFVADPFIVSGQSMDNTFADGQYLIVDQLSYHFENPSRGDVIIFRYPKDPSLFFIKRVIGLPGETVSINNGVVTISNIGGNPNASTTLSELPNTVHTTRRQQHSVPTNISSWETIEMKVQTRASGVLFRARILSAGHFCGFCRRQACRYSQAEIRNWVINN